MDDIKKKKQSKSNVLKFPVLKNVEYIDLIKNRTNVLSFEGHEVEGKTWREFQKMIGAKLPDGAYSYVIKIKKDDIIYKGLVRTAGKVTTMTKVKSESTPDIEKKLIDLASQINKMGSGNNVSVDLLIQVTRQSFETQISFLNIELTRKDATNQKLEIKIESLYKELEDSDILITDLKGQTGISQYISIAKEFISMKAGLAKPIESLSASEASDIPPEIIEILGVVNWGNVSPEIINDITSTMKIFIQKLPLKEG